MKNMVKKLTVSFSLVMVVMMVAAVSAFAAADTETVTAMTTAFTDVKLTAIATLGALAQVAIVLFAAIYAWKYGKKVFSIIAK